MKHLLNFTLVFFVAFFSISCQNNSNQKASVQFYSNVSELQADMSNTTINTSAKPKMKSIEFKTFMDSQLNMAMFEMPVPADWQINRTQKDNVFISGPNGFKVLGEVGFNYTYSSDPYLNQSMQQAGNAVSPVKTPEQLVNEILVPNAKKEGAKLIKMYKLPKLIAYDKNYEQFTFTSGYQQSKTIDVLASEWEDNEGNSSLIIMRYNVATDIYQQKAWGFYLQIMECETKYFEQAKQDFVYAQVNKKYNPRYLHHYYMKDANYAKQSGKIHEARMAQLRAEGDAIIQRGKEYSASVDRNHQKFMDAHLERTTVSTTSGQSYKVNAGSSNYWMNSNGEYISSNNPNYNPNTDPSYNNINWKSTTINN